jgi:hypothetical protein
MRRSLHLLCSLLFGCFLFFATLGCTHHYYRTYDPYYNDYHTWGPQETVYYNQWVTEEHIDPHRDYNHLSKDEQKRYWDWRHSHDHDHDQH